MSDPEFLIRSYGYPMLVAGTMAEGETVLIMGGLMASQGYLDLSLVILCGFIGAIAGDHTFFLLGRRRGISFALNRPVLRDRIGKVELYCTKYKTIILAGFRFICGFRALIPFFFGVGSISAGKFFLFDAFGASLWAISVGLMGYFAGGIAGAALGRVKSLPIAIVAISMCAALLVGLVARHRRNTK